MFLTAEVLDIFHPQDLNPIIHMLLWTLVEVIQVVATDL